MKKHTLFVLLAVMFLILPVRAAEDTMDNFIRSKEYSGQFSDLTGDSAFYENAAALYEYGLSVGKADGTFGLKDELSVSQTIIFAGRIRSLYRTGDAEAGAAAFQTEATRPACMPYLEYLKAEKVLGNELDEVLFSSATRAQMAHILANILPEEALPRINEDIISEAYSAGGFAADVTDETPYQQDILMLYRCGISHGSDDIGSFYPDAPITRGAAAAMLTRLADPALRITLVWQKPVEVPDISNVTYADLVEPGIYIPAPATDEDLLSSVRHMLAAEEDTLSFSIPDLSMTDANLIATQVLTFLKTYYVEQSYNHARSTLLPDGVSIQLTSAGAGEKTQEYRDAALMRAKEIHDALWQEGYLTTDMTEFEIARVYFIWLCLNADYDYEAGDSSVSHSAYNPLVNGLAVCDGYTSAYNLLLKLEGINCSAYLAQNHIWTIATLDGTEYHIDTTWGDMGSSADMTFFAMSAYFSMQVHQNIS